MKRQRDEYSSSTGRKRSHGDSEPPDCHSPPAKDPSLIWKCLTKDVLIYILSIVFADFTSASTQQLVAISRQACFGRIARTCKIFQQASYLALNQKFVNDLFCWAAEGNKIALLRRLLQDIRVDPATNLSYALRWSCRRGHIDTVRLLLDDGRSDPSALDYSCFQSARHNQHSQVLILLSERCKTPNFPRTQH